MADRSQQTNQDLLGKRFAYDDRTFTVTSVEGPMVTLVDHEKRERKLTARQLRDGLWRGVLKAQH